MVIVEIRNVCTTFAWIPFEDGWAQKWLTQNGFTEAELNRWTNTNSSAVNICGKDITIRGIITAKIHTTTPAAELKFRQNNNGSPRP
jgi:hypothetical protein